MLKEQLSKIGTRTTCPVAIIIRNGKILLGYRHYKKGEWKEISVWTAPGGKCEEGEKVENGLRREVKEEVGIEDLEIVEFIKEVPGAREGDIVPLFFCTTKQDFTLMEPHKFSEWRWVPISEFLKGAPGPLINLHAREIISDFLSSRVLL